MKMIYGPYFVNQALCLFMLQVLADFCFLDTWLDLGYAKLEVNKFPFCVFKFVPFVRHDGGFHLGWIGFHLLYNKFIIYGCCLSLLCLLAIDDSGYKHWRFSSNCSCDWFHVDLVHMLPNVDFSWHSIDPLTIQHVLIQDWIIAFNVILRRAIKYNYNDQDISNP